LTRPTSHGPPRPQSSFNGSSTRRATLACRRAHLATGWLFLAAADFDGVVREAGLAADLASIAGDTEAQVQAHSLMYEAVWTAGRHEETIAAARAFRAFADRLGLLRFEGSWAALAEAESLYALGRLDESMDVIEEQLRDPPGDRSSALLHLQAAQVGIARGALADAERRLEQAISEATSGDDEIIVGYVSLTRAQLANAEGRFDDTRSIVLAAGPRLAAAAGHRSAPYLIWEIVEVGLDAEATRAEAAVAAGDGQARAEARGVATTMSSYVDAVRLHRQEAGLPDSYRHRGDEAVLAAQRARIEGRDDPELWVAAADGFPGGSVESVFVGYRRAEAMLAAQAGREALTDVVAPAYARAVEIGARPLAIRLESVARRARITLRPPDQAVPPDGVSPAADVAIDPGHEALRKRGLSDREIEVLTLVAAGYSNSQIADRLFISAKTASVHVSHILDKLGVSGRTEAATIGVRLGLPEVEPAEL
jgi:ATP/maltotriose-dependent transcriptional regulator MalT